MYCHGTRDRLTQTIIPMAVTLLAFFNLNVKISLDAFGIDVIKQKPAVPLVLPLRNQDPSPSSNETSTYAFHDTDSIEHALPAWTQLPRTQFTDNVLRIINDLDLAKVSDCPQFYSLVVSSRNTEPLVQCQPKANQNRIWCQLLTQIFASRTLPFNVSIGFELGDRLESDNSRGCIGSSSPSGKLVMPNMEDIIEMVTTNVRETNPEEYRWSCKVDVPWEKRNTTPVFRGTPWYPRGYRANTCLKPDFQFSDSLFFRYPRFMAVAFSYDNPSLLNAKFGEMSRHVAPCFARNATNGFHRLLPLNLIPVQEFFSNFQVALVLGGIGAAFRLSRHFMTSTAVILADYGYEEWFTILAAFRSFHSTRDGPA